MLVSRTPLRSLILSIDFWHACMILFILPFIPLADMVSTQYSLAFGGKEGGLLARPVYERYGELGLVSLSIFTFFVLLGCVWLLRFAKRRFAQNLVSKLHRVVLVFAVNFFFLVEACLAGVVVQNFLVPLLSPSLALNSIQYGVTLAYLGSVSFFARTEMKRLIRD